MNKYRITNPNNNKVRDCKSRTTDRSKCKWIKDCEGTMRPIYLEGTCVVEGKKYSFLTFGPTDEEIKNGMRPDSGVTNCLDPAS